jgi:hypothetical protein
LYQWVTGFLGVAIAATIMYLVRRNHLHVRYAMLWIPVALVVLLFGLFPWMSDLLARAIGVSYPPVLVIVVAIGVGFVKVLLMDIERSRNETRLSRLIQEVGMLELRLKELEGSVARTTKPAPGNSSEATEAEGRRQAPTK